MTQQPRTPGTEAGRRFFDVLHRMGLAHDANGTVGTEILAIEAEARADLLAQIALAAPQPEPSEDQVRRDAITADQRWSQGYAAGRAAGLRQAEHSAELPETAR